MWEGRSESSCVVSLSRAAEISRILSHLLFLGSDDVTSKKIFYYAFLCLSESMGFSSTMASFFICTQSHSKHTMSNSGNPSQDVILCNVSETLFPPQYHYRSLHCLMKMTK